MRVAYKLKVVTREHALVLLITEGRELFLFDKKFLKFPVKQKVFQAAFQSY